MPASGNAAARHPSVATLIDESIRRVADRTAVGVADGSACMSYRQLGETARTLGHRLTVSGITRGETIALYCDNRLEFVVGLLAAWTAGAAVVPVSPQLIGTEVQARLVAVGADCVLLPERLRDSYPAAADARLAWTIHVDAATATVAVTDVRPAADQAARPRRKVGRGPDQDHALLLFTTGSTGTPKIVPLTHANLAAAVTGIVSAYHLGPGDATLLAMPLFHGHGLIAGLLATLATGGAAHLPAGGRFSAHAFWDEITRAKATWYTAVPTVHQILLARASIDYPADRPPALRFIRSCSTPLAPAIQRKTGEQFRAPVIQAYGMTETSHQAASNPLPQDGASKDASVGLATGLQIRIIAASGHPAAVGETGEVCVRGLAVTSGYLNDPQGTAAAFTGGWFRTGELGYLDSDDYLFLTGRTKEMINRGGEKIAPYDVEAVLLSHPAVQDALAFAVPDAKYGEEINAAVILMPGQHATEAELQEHCRSKLSAFEIPRKIYFLNRFPRTSKGDGDRRALAATVTEPGSP